MTSEEMGARIVGKSIPTIDTMPRIGILLILLLHSHVIAEAPKALPVDPSDITPETTEPKGEVEKPKPKPPEATPIEPGKVTVPEPKKNPKSDAPEIEGLPTGEDAVRLQIFLDQEHFGPGVIDGVPGRFTILAINAWNEAHGHPQNDITAVMAEARKQITHPFATAIVPEEAGKWVNWKLPYKRSQQVNYSKMSYRSYVEFMSERYHTDVEFLKKINSAETINGLTKRKPIIVPNVKPFLVENLTGARYETEEELAARHVVVDTKVNQARVYEHAPAALIVIEEDGAEPKVKANSSLVAAFPITPGQPRFIKYGQWEMRNAVELPVWRYDPSLLAGKGRGNYSMNIPPGPNSPVGVIWMGLSVSGIGIHGTSNPETIGRARSAGCIRMANWDAMRMPKLVRPGASVEIR